MIETGNGKWRKKVTGKFRFKRTGESTYINLGNVRMHAQEASIERTKFVTADKGFLRTTYEEPATIERRYKIGIDEELPDFVRLDLLAGAHTVVDQNTAADQSESFTSVKKGQIIQLAKLNVSSVVVEVSSVAKVLGTDYLLDADAGTIEILRGGSIADGATVDVDYDAGEADLIKHVSEGELTVEGSFVLDEFDQHDGKPRARYSASGMLIVSNRGDNDGKKFSEFELELLVTSAIQRIGRVD